ncbi:hypothetical protein ACHAWO_001027 [Cyclotella atomus]|uniref:Uncharacterized protein n=1 Tax=Cyclotella atomus TaxID=382360 RepID=A0ABD3NMG8_9STRA
MNLSAAVSSFNRCYSSVQDEEQAKRSLSPTSLTMKRTSGGSQSKPTTISALKSTVRSIIPKRLLISPCLHNAATVKGRRYLCHGAYHDDDITPVIFYADEDVVRKVDEPSYMDPFAIEYSKDPVPPKEKATPKSQEGLCSPTSVFGLFTVEEERESSIFDNFSDDQEEAVFLDDPFFPPRCLTRVFDENTSIDICESVLSINAPSVREDENDAANEEKETTSEWFGFFASDSFNSIVWDDENEGSFEMVDLK